MADTPSRAHALDHIVVVLFENRSLDNVLGRLYGPDDEKTPAVSALKQERRIPISGLSHSRQCMGRPSQCPSGQAR
jgi:hypothetical protein